MTIAQNIDLAALRDEWLGRLKRLTEQIRDWAKAGGWETRLIEKKMRDSQIGEYQAPALLMQEGTTRILLEPIARSAPGAEGVVNIYLMPAYDDIASLYYYNGGWHIHYVSPGTSVMGDVQQAEGRLLSKDALQQVLDEMMKHAVQND